MKRLFAFILTFCMLLSSITVAVPVSAADGAPAAPIAVSYEIDALGSAEGTVTVTLPAGHGADDVYLYWGDASGKLADYSALTRVKVAGTTVTTRVAVGTFIPEEATRLLAYTYSDVGGFSADYAAYDLPQGATLDTSALGELTAEFQAVSDMHVSITRTAKQGNSELMLNMLEDVKKVSPNSIGIFSNGDNTDQATDVDYEEFKRIVNETEGEPPI